MEDFARGALTGIAIGGLTTAVVKINMFTIDKLSMLNNLAIETAVGMTLSTLENIKIRRLQQRAADEGDSTVAESES